MDDKREKEIDKDTEQYVKDVRTVTHHEVKEHPVEEDPNEVAANEKVQEENKKSQKNAEMDAKYGDSSDAERSKVNPGE